MRLILIFLSLFSLQALAQVHVQDQVADRVFIPMPEENSSLFFDKEYSPVRLEWVADNISKKVFRNPIGQLGMNQFAEVEEINGGDLLAALKPEVTYTFVITKDKVEIGMAYDTSWTNRNDSKGIFWLADKTSKHYVMAHGGNVYFAGEMAVDDGKLHFSSASGTYQPDEISVRQAEAFFKTYLGIEAEGHYTQDHMGKYLNFTPTETSHPVRLGLFPYVKAANLLPDDE